MARILLTGATGLIGSGVLAALRAAGHEVVAVVRDRSTAARRLPTAELVVQDIAHATIVQDWIPHLRGIDAVVNCAGVLQDAPGVSVDAVHVRGIGALFAACAEVGVRRVIHVSALGADTGAVTDFSRSKHAADDALMRTTLDWVILRPSVVLGRAVYGGSAMLRGLAALPFVPVTDGGAIQPIMLDDVAATVVFFLRPQAPARVVLDLVGPQRLTVPDVIGAYRRWLGWSKGRAVTLPAWLAAVVYRSADLLGLLGWRSPMRSTMSIELQRGSVGDPAEWTRVTGMVPCSLANALAAEPATVQDRWFAQLYLLKPLILAVLAGFWILSGLIGLGPGLGAAAAVLAPTALADSAKLLVIVGALADIAVGAGLAIRRTARVALWGGVMVTAAYIVGATVLLPSLWLDPLGPILKTLPIMLLHFAALAILDDR